MEEDGEDLTPFWLQSTTDRRRTDRIRDGLSSLFFSSGLLIILLLVTAVAFLVFVVPSTISFSAQVFRPNSVKKSWDSLNIVLVLFALVFGLLSKATNEDRNTDEYQTSSPVSRNEIQKSNPATPQRKWYDYSTSEAQKSNLSTFQQQWSGYSDQMAYNNGNISRGGLRRNSSSYPDLIEASSQLMSRDDPWRFYDDMRVDTYWMSETGQLLRRRSWKDKFEDTRVAESKNIYADTFVNSLKEDSDTPRAPSPTPPTSSPPPPPSSTSLPSPPEMKPPTSPMHKEKPKRAYRSVPHKKERRSKRVMDTELEDREPISSPVTPPPPPPPPPPPALPQFVDQKSSKTDKKRSGGNATKDFLNSLYHKKKKKQRQRSIENFDALLHQSQTPPIQFKLLPATQPPPPPPLPPPPSVFHNLFPSKKSKKRRPELDDDISASTSSPPQPTLPTQAIQSKPLTSQSISVISQISPKPVKVRSFDSVEENSNSGGESPLIPIPPPPPPPPPFAKSLSWKFVMQGDYVRIDSLSSRSGSSDIDDMESEGTPTTTEGADATTYPSSPLFFPSPDVNAKAENFISKFRAGLKLEKINSMNKRQSLGLSNLGRGSETSDSTQL